MYVGCMRVDASQSESARASCMATDSNGRTTKRVWVVLRACGKVFYYILERSQVTKLTRTWSNTMLCHSFDAVNGRRCAKHIFLYDHTAQSHTLVANDDCADRTWTRTWSLVRHLLIFYVRPPDVFEIRINRFTVKRTNRMDVVNHLCVNCEYGSLDSHRNFVLFSHFDILFIHKNVVLNAHIRINSSRANQLVELELYNDDRIQSVFIFIFFPSTERNAVKYRSAGGDAVCCYALAFRLWS